MEQCYHAAFAEMAQRGFIEEVPQAEVGCAQVPIF